MNATPFPRVRVVTPAPRPQAPSQASPELRRLHRAMRAAERDQADAEAAWLDREPGDEVSEGTLWAARESAIAATALAVTAFVERWERENGL